MEAVCESLRSRGVRIAGHMDVACRIERTLGIALAPCRILFVLPDSASWRGGAIHPWAASFLPIHVVISECGRHSEVDIQNRLQTVPGELAPGVFGPVTEAQRQVSEAVEAVAAKPSLMA
jgi:hypothetical protein